MDKNKIPPVILRIYGDIGKIINYDIVHFVTDAQGMYIADNDPNTNFYFKVSYPQSYLVEKAPASAQNTGLGKNNYNQASNVIESFKNWQNIIRDYQEIPRTLHIKDLEKSYYDEFIANIELLDDDAQTAPFDLAKQHVLTEYCHITKERLLQEKTDENAQEIDAIVADVNNLGNEISQLTKAETTKRVFRIWAKARKIGFGLFKAIAEGLLTDLAKDGIVHISQTIRTALPAIMETISKIPQN